MRKRAVLLFMVLASFVLTVPAWAQAPASPLAPKVTITGLVDNVAGWAKNMSMRDLDVSRASDSEMYGRTRVRPDITAEVGTTKFVLGMEFDYSFGQVSNNIDQVAGLGTARGSERVGLTTGASLNTDIARLMEVKWAYTEFDLPLVPWKTTVRVGAQPFAATYKQSAYAANDFAGLHLTSVINPALKFNFDWVQVQESATGRSDGFSRGDDFAIITSLELTPFKGLDLRPTYSYYFSDGVATTTFSSPRLGRGGVSNSTTFFPNGATEDRHTLGLDARWRYGAFSLDPTVFYQFGEREMVSAVGKFAGVRRSQDMSAWFTDVRGGWQLGPLLLEAAAIYTTGNKARSDIRDASRDVNFYQPLTTDSSYYLGWAEIWALGIDYNVQGINFLAAGANTITSIGYDKYGLVRLGFRPSYAVTPNFTVRAAATANWTAEAVDTRGALAAATGITPSDSPRGRERYLGTELDLGFTYRFAPNVTIDAVYGYNWSGKALASATSTSVSADTTVTPNITRPNDNPKDIQLAVVRVRYTF